MTNSKKIILAGLAALTLAACGAAAACVRPYNPEEDDIPGIRPNAVFDIEHTNLNFALGMTVDSADIIVACGCSLPKSDGSTFVITKQELLNGKVKYTEFDTSKVGQGRVVVSYKEGSSFIDYQVDDYKVNFWLDSQTAYKENVRPNAYFTSDMTLACGINIGDYNYATDPQVIADAPQSGLKFNGWYDVDGNPVKGTIALQPPTGGHERRVDLYAGFLTDEQFATYDISYDLNGRKIFAGYSGEAIECLTIPESVTYVNFTKLFSGEVNYDSLFIPSTVRLSLPLSSAIDSSGLKEIIIDEDNTTARSYNGAIYSNSYDTLYMMPAGATSHEFHEKVKTFANYSCAYWNIDSFTIPESVTSLNNYCFAYSSLSSIEGLSGVKLMSGVFYQCPNLELVKEYENGVYNMIGNGEYILSSVIDKTVSAFNVMEGTVGIAGDAFNGCTNLVTIDLGYKIKSIGDSAFANCTSLESIGMPMGVKEFGSSVFFNCTSLKSIALPANLVYVKDNKQIENAIPDNMLRGCTSLETVSLPAGLVSIGSAAFYGCTALTKIAIPSTVQEIGSSAFYSCKLLSDVKLPAALTKLGASAFSNCASLTEINLDDCPQLTALANRCFESTALKSVTLPESITVVPDYCFYRSKITSVTMTGVEKISQYAFAYCTLLTEINWGSKISVIGTRAFSSDSALKSVSLPDTVTNVEGYAFASTGLVNFHIGSGLTLFGVYAMKGEEFSTVSPALYLTTKLQSITVDENNEYFKAVDGVLYGKFVAGKEYGEGGVLYCLPSAYQQESFTPISSVKVILPYSAHYLSVVKTITLNEGLENIGKGAFYYSSSPTTLSIPASVTYIGASILLNCTTVKNFSIAEGNATYSSDGNCVYSRSEKSLIMYMGINPEVVVDDGTEVINMGVFMNNAVITSVVIPDSVKTIGDKAFSGCSKLETISIGSGLESLGVEAFGALASLESVTVDGQNKAFKCVNGVLYSHDGKKVILCPAKNGWTELKLESGVTEIGDWAFSYNSTLKTVVIPQGVVSIGNYSFYECRGIESLRLSRTLETLGNYTFAFKDSINPTDKEETRFCNTLKSVVVYGNLKSMGDFTFYGQYGLEKVYFEMDMAAYNAFVNASGKNTSHLTHGITDGAGNHYNTVSRYLYIETKPEITYNDFGWFHFDSNGNPVIWENN